MATERATWGSHIEALLSYLGFCVGFGNIWRFPYLCYRNGGGAFLIPYFLMLFIAGVPLFFLESAMGQFSSKGAIGVWSICPLFKGLGYTSLLAGYLCIVYLTPVMGYMVFYLFASMRSQLPWSTCDNPWNTPACTRAHGNNWTTSTNETYTYDKQLVNTTTQILTVTNTSAAHESIKWPAEEYWQNYVLNISSGIDELGGVQWKLVGCIFLAWFIIFLCLSKGIKSSGKAVYVTATFPYVMLTILLIRGATLPGATNGLLYYLTPDLSKLKSAKVWGDAASQVMYSLGPSWGVIVTYSSYNKFNRNCEKDAIIAAVASCLTSAYAGLVIFSVIGFISHELGLPIEKVMTSGPGLVFVVYPEALARMPFAPLWSVVFFIMLFTVALDTMFAQTEAVVTAIEDQFPGAIRKHRTKATFAIVLSLCLFSIPLTTQGGIYIVNLMDWYVGVFPILLVAFFQIMVVIYIYGYKQFAMDIEEMLGRAPNTYWKIAWSLISPVAILFVLVFNAVLYQSVFYDNYTYPPWAEGVGFGIALLEVLCIPSLMIYQIFQKYIKDEKSSILEIFKSLLKPTKGWGPAHTIPSIRQDIDLTDKEINCSPEEAKALHIADEDNKL